MSLPRVFRLTGSLRPAGALLLAWLAVLVVAVPALADTHNPTLSPSQESERVSLRPTAMPPLPFRSPQVGPIIKRAHTDDIDKRTTAFIPTGERFLPDFPMPEEDRWIRVDLSEQVLLAYENGKPIRGFIISSGLPRTPTVTGEFRIRMKVRSQTMSGGDPALGNYYSLPNVEWVQYFFEDYGIHGTYWHNNFGNPMSHGCVNMTNADAKWLFDWAGPVWEDKTVWQPSTTENPGTLVIVHQ